MCAKHLALLLNSYAHTQRALCFGIKAGFKHFVKFRVFGL